jgi:hypothetical protein
MVSVTELQDFMRCRWQWDTISPNRQSPQPRGAPRIELHLGSAVHHAIERQADGKDPLVALRKWYESERRKIGKEYLKRVGTAMSAQETARLEQSAQLAEAMVQHYFQRYGDRPIAPLTYAATELSWRIPTSIVSKDGREVYIVGTCDGVGMDPDGGLWVIEHKTYGQKPDLRWLQTDHQITGYGWAIGILLGQPIQGVLYDGLMKKAPQMPRTLQNGNLSQEMNASVSFHSYLRAIRKHHGLGDDEIAPAMYHGFLRRLKERDSQEQTPFFTRKEINLTAHQIRRWASDAFGILEDIADDPRIYKNFRWEGCWDCFVADLCHADQKGADVEYIKETGYEVSDYRWQYANMLEVSPEQVGSLEELQVLLARQQPLEIEQA